MLEKGKIQARYTHKLIKTEIHFNGPSQRIISLTEALKWHYTMFSFDKMLFLRHTLKKKL